ncbi:MAG: hypothetical protein NTV34_13035 [Proteobacteria bacterium]|nr:hypothetical protein [Pseudomonadota bacterium]
MTFISLRAACGWCALLLCLALARVHFRVVTTNVAYNLGRLKEQESSLLEQRSILQAELAKLTGKKQLEGLSHKSSESSHNSPPSRGLSH